jgi:hypothetical protein
MLKKDLIQAFAFRIPRAGFPVKTSTRRTRATSRWRKAGHRAAWRRHGVAREQQDILYARDRWSLPSFWLDAAATAIKHVVESTQGCQSSPSQPSSETLITTSLWRYFKCLPERGHRHFQPLILRGGAVVRVHPEILRTRSFPRNVAKSLG